MNLFARPEGLLGLVAGFLLWSSAFLMLYGAHALGCEFGWDRLAVGPANAMHVTLIAVLLVHAAVFVFLLMFIRRLRRTRRSGGPAFVGHLSLALSAAAFFAVAWAGLPVFAYPVCR